MNRVIQRSVISTAGPYYQPSQDAAPFVQQNVLRPQLHRLGGSYLSGLGDDSVDVDTTPWYQLGQQLVDLQNGINAELAAMQADSSIAGTVDPVTGQTLGKELVTLQSRVGDATSQYQAIYTLFTGAPDPGLSGVLIPAAVAAAIIALAAAIALISHDWAAYQTAKLAAANKAQVLSQANGILSQAQAKLSTGDAAGYALLMAQYNKLIEQAGPGGPAPSFDLGQFFSSNAPYLAAVVVGVALLSKR